MTRPPGGSSGSQGLQDIILRQSAGGGAGGNRVSIGVDFLFLSPAWYMVGS
jgi:hypothetical protein